MGTPFVDRKLEYPEITSHHRDRDVEDGHSADEAFEGAGVAVAVDDEVRRVLGDRACEAVASEEGVDPHRLALERHRRGRVVEEDEAQRAMRDGLEAALQRPHLGRRLRVDLAEERLAEVGQLPVRKPAPAALRPDDADLHPVDVHARPGARRTPLRGLAVPGLRGRPPRRPREWETSVSSIGRGGYRDAVSVREFERMMPTLKKAAAALRDADVPFLLAGR